MSPKELLALVEAAIIAKSLTPSGFGRAVNGDPSLVFNMREGRELRHETAQRVLKFINGKVTA
jgi:hypothetical protein